MKEACGEYVWFFDSDDWVSENVLGNIVQSLKDCDICILLVLTRKIVME